MQFKRINFEMLENKLKRNWQKHGTVKIVDTSDNIYLVRLSLMDDYRYVLFRDDGCSLDQDSKSPNRTL